MAAPAAHQVTRNVALRGLPPLSSDTATVPSSDVSTVQPAIALAAMPVMLANPPAARMADPLVDDRAWWKRWPMIVMTLAAIAIVVAIVMMFWPQQSPATKKAAPTLAPSRMDTNPLPEQPGATPTQPPAGAAPSDPWGGVTPAVPAPDDPTNPALVDPNDPTAGQDARNEFVGKLAGTVCTKITRCNDLDASTSSLVCDSIVSVLTNAATPGCPLDPQKAATCLQAINRISCDQSLDTSTAALLLNDFPTCIAALRC
jgi:hypothetical protein